MSTKIHQNDTTQFIVTIEDCDGSVNISSANVTQFVFQRPVTYDNLVVNASFLTNGADGQLTYTAKSTDLNTVGLWKLQAIVQIGPSGWKSTISTFKVERNL